MTKDDIEKIKRIEKIFKESFRTDILEKEYAELIKGMSPEVKKEKLRFIIDNRQAKKILPLNIVDELIASLNTDEDKLELINIAANDGKEKEKNMFNKTILSLSTDEIKVGVIKKDWSYFYSKVNLISSLSTDELKIKIMEETGYDSRIIASLSSDKLKIELMKKLEENMKIDDYAVIISSLSTDKIKLEQMEQKKEKFQKDQSFSGGQWETIIASLSSDRLKLEQMEQIEELDKFYSKAHDLGKIIASLSDEKLKLEQLDKFYIMPHDLGKIIASLSGDELKLEQLEKLQDKLYTVRGKWGVSEGFSEAISSLSDDKIRIQALHKYEKNIENKEKIILSLSTDEAKIKEIDETGYITGNIITSLCDDKTKIELMKKHIKELNLYMLGDIIKSIESDEEKIKQLQILNELIQEIPEEKRYRVYYSPAEDIIMSLTTDEARLKCIESGMNDSKLAFLLLETEEAKLKIIELLNDKKYSENIIRKLGGFASEKNDIIRDVILSLNTNEKKIETLLNLQDDFDERMVREIIATLDYYDYPKENIMFKLSGGGRITSNNKTLNIPIKKIIDSEDAEQFNDCYFKYFNSEIENKQQIFQNTDEEMRDFLKFAKTLGCFSKDKVLDENGRETEVYLGQKASSLLVQLLKTDELRIRKIS